MTRPRRSARRGVTLIELLVVLVLLAVSAAVVLPALMPPSAKAEAAPEAGVIATARRIAIRRGEPLRLRIDRDGVWALVTLHGGDVLEGGRLRVAREATPSATTRASDSAESTSAVVLTIDALGSCQPGDGRGQGVSYDPLTCRWNIAATRTASLPARGAR